jgi:hypothetical protein
MPAEEQSEYEENNGGDYDCEPRRGRWVRIGGERVLLEREKLLRGFIDQVWKYKCAERVF